MYQNLLARRYLTSKIMPLLAAAAVMLCTAMVLIVWSVMGGFLALLVGSGRTLVGDVVISWPQVGFAHYDHLIQILENEPAVHAAAPMIETFGVLALPNDRQQPVVIKGVEPLGLARVTSYLDTLWWKRLDKPLPRDSKGADPRLAFPETMDQAFRQGQSLTRVDPHTSLDKPAVALGIHVSGLNRRTAQQFYVPQVAIKPNADGTEELLQSFLPATGTVVLHVAPLTRAGRDIQMVSRRFPVANEFQTGIWDVDSRTVMVHLGALQNLLHMDQGERLADASQSPVRVEVDPATGERRFVTAPAPTVVDPARVTHVIVRAKGDVSNDEQSESFAQLCREAYARFAQAHPGDVPDPVSIEVATWRDLNRTMISAVEKERALVLFLFSIVSLTSVFLILAIFWSMVAEKTRDVGTLRAIGATRAGVASVWLAYGLAIGVVGAALGVALAYAIVRNINPIHEWMGRQLNIQIWDPRVYVFTSIPNTIKTADAILVALVAVGSSVLGALIPALRAALLRPVQALRFE